MKMHTPDAYTHAMVGVIVRGVAVDMMNLIGMNNETCLLFERTKGIIIVKRWNA
jgi:hypothetical protein